VQASGSPVCCFLGWFSNVDMASMSQNLAHIAPKLCMWANRKGLQAAGFLWSSCPLGKYQYLSALASPADEGQGLQGEKTKADMTFGLVWRCMPQNPVV
jgi:hypothetical protein